MHLHNPCLEQILRRRVRARVRAQRRSFHRRHRDGKSRPSRVAAYTFHGFRLVLLVSFLMGAANRGSPAAAQLALLSVWGVYCGIACAENLLMTFHQSPDLYALHGLPVAGDEVFRWLWQRFVRSTCWYIPDFVVGGLVIVGISASADAVWPILAVGGLQWLVCVSLGTILAYRFPSDFYGRIRLGAWVLVLILVLAEKSLAPMLFAALERGANLLNLFLPTAWPAALFGPWLRGHGVWTDFVMLVPVAVLVIWAARCRGRIRCSCQANVNQPVPPDLTDESAEESEVAEATADDAAGRRGPTALRDAILSREFLAPAPLPSRGWLERWFLGRLSARSALLVEWTQQSPPAWSALLIRAGIVLVVGLVFGQLIGLVWQGYGDLLRFYYLVVGGLGALMGFPIGSELDRAFSWALVSGSNVPQHALFPVRFDEIARLQRRAAWVRTLAAAPLFLAYATVVAWLQHQPPLPALALCFKALWIFVALQPLFVVLRFSAGTNDTHRANVALWVLIAASVLLGSATLGLGVALFLLKPTGCLIAGAFLPLPPWLFFCVYRALNDRGKFDLLGDANREM